MRRFKAPLDARRRPLGMKSIGIRPRRAVDLAQTVRVPGFLMDVGERWLGQRLTPPVAIRAMAATAMITAVSHPRILAALPFT